MSLKTYTDHVAVQNGVFKINHIKREAKHLRDRENLSHIKSLEASAKAVGFADWMDAVNFYKEHEHLYYEHKDMLQSMNQTGAR